MTQSWKSGLSKLKASDEHAVVLCRNVSESFDVELGLPSGRSILQWHFDGLTRVKTLIAAETSTVADIPVIIVEKADVMATVKENFAANNNFDLRGEITMVALDELTMRSVAVALKEKFPKIKWFHFCDVQNVAELLLDPLVVAELGGDTSSEFVSKFFAGRDDNHKTGVGRTTLSGTLLAELAKRSDSVPPLQFLDCPRLEEVATGLFLKTKNYNKDAVTNVLADRSAALITAAGGRNLVESLDCLVGTLGPEVSGFKAIDTSENVKLLSFVEVSPLLSVSEFDVVDLKAVLQSIYTDRKKLRLPVQLEPLKRQFKCVMVTGAAGFVGSHLCATLALKYPNTQILGLDKLDYCASLSNLAELDDVGNFEFVEGNILSQDLINHLLRKHGVDAIMHLAAQTHVDNSFGNSLTFTKNNVLGTHVLLECAKAANVQCFLHMSTDEVYGETGDDETVRESERILAPTNPYAATKAAAEHLVQAYRKSFNLPIMIVRGNNIYGPHQFPEKLIPKFSLLLSRGEKVPMHGDGSNTRNFVYVGDTVRALVAVLERGELGEIYNIGGTCERSNVAVTTDICNILDCDATERIDFVPDRPFNDKRYTIDSTKMNLLGWRPLVDWTIGLPHTVNWFVDADLDRWDRVTVEKGLQPHPRLS